MTAIVPGPQPSRAEVFASVSSLAALGRELATRPLGPRPAFREELRRRLLEEAAELPSPARGLLAVPSPSTAEQRADERATTPDRGVAGRPRPIRTLAAAGAALVVLGTGLTVAAAGAALPGEVLYPVKRVGEQVRTTLDPTGTPSRDAARTVASRLGELEALNGSGAPPSAARWSAMETALADADAAVAATAASVPAPVLADALAPARQRLVALLPGLSDAQRPAVLRLLAAIDAVGSEGVVVTGGTARADGPGRPFLPTALALRPATTTLFSALPRAAAPGPGSSASRPAPTASEAPSASGRTHSGAATRSTRRPATTGPESLGPPDVPSVAAARVPEADADAEPSTLRPALRLPATGSSSDTGSASGTPTGTTTATTTGSRAEADGVLAGEVPALLDPLLARPSSGG